VAATLAGILSSQPVNLGLTRKVIGGFAGIPNNVLMTMTQPYKNQLSAAGVCVIEPAPGTGALWVRHGTTTDPTNTVTREFSLVRCGTPSSRSSRAPTTRLGSSVTRYLHILDIITSLATAALEYLMAQNIIAGYTSPSVVQDPNSPDVVNVTFGYSPEYPLNIINVQYSISTTTGTITPATSGGNASATSAYSGFCSRIRIRSNSCHRLRRAWWVRVSRPSISWESHCLPGRSARLGSGPYPSV